MTVSAWVSKVMVKPISIILIKLHWQFKNGVSCFEHTDRLLIFVDSTKDGSYLKKVFSENKKKFSRIHLKVLLVVGKNHEKDLVTLLEALKDITESK